MEKRTYPNSTGPNSKLETGYISPDVPIALNVYFETAIVKLQTSSQHQLTVADNKSSSSLIKPIPTTYISDGATLNDSEEDNFKCSIFKRRKVSSSSVEYLDFKFVHISVAQMERLWSTMNLSLTQNRNLLTSQLVEALVFLELNCRSWDAQTVGKVI